MDREFIEAVSKIIPENQLFIDEPMKKHTTFRIGGNADLYIRTDGIEQIVKIIQLCNSESVPYFVLGNGSNVLVSDKGYRGVVIQIYNNIEEISVEEEVIVAPAGMLLSRVANFAKENELTGMEFSAGIPGTIGGGVMMNEGAYGGEFKDIVVSAKVIDKQGNVLILSNEELRFGYRHSVIKEKGHIVLEVTLRLKKGILSEIHDKMEEYKVARTTKQPLDYPSAGSTFKRPEGHFAGKLIMDAGLRGKTVGGAQISEKHCGFVINKDNATAADVIELVREVAQEVNAQFGVALEMEVIMLGDF